VGIFFNRLAKTVYLKEELIWRLGLAAMKAIVWYMLNTLISRSFYITITAKRDGNDLKR
jgi:hypothetical protein